MSISVHSDGSRKAEDIVIEVSADITKGSPKLKSMYVKLYNCTCLSFVTVTAKSMFLLTW